MLLLYMSLNFLSSILDGMWIVPVSIVYGICGPPGEGALMPPQPGRSSQLVLVLALGKVLAFGLQGPSPESPESPPSSSRLVLAL